MEAPHDTIQVLISDLPDLFPELMAPAIQSQDVSAWAASHGIGQAR